MESQQKNLLLFFALTFVITWGLCGYLLATIPSGALQNITPKFIIIAITSGLTPTLVALGICFSTKTSDLLFGQFRTHFPKRLLIPAICITPIIGLLSYLPFHNVKLPLPPPILIMGLIWPLFSSFGEELGWRGFAFPALKQRWGFTPAALLVGIIWGFWHLPMDYIGLRSHGWYFIPEFLLLGPALLTAHSIIMSYLYCKGNGAILLAIAYHFTITASAIILSNLFFQNSNIASGIFMLTQPALIALFALCVALFVLIKGDRAIIDSKKK